MRYWRLLSLLPLLVFILFFSSCSSSTDPEPSGNGDTTPPVVVQVSPDPDDVGVPVSGTITIHFNEPMDQSSHTGNITLSQGTISSMAWANAQTLEVSHSSWAQGVEVTVTVGTGLSDLAGNGLAQAMSWSFTTYTDDFLLLTSSPADNETAVPINSQVFLTFSKSVNGSTLDGAITVSSPDKANHPFTSSGGGDEWNLVFASNLPASTVITVIIDQTLEDTQANTLDAAASFSFTTGAVADTTPPELVSIEPASGGTISANTSYVRMTFNEPMTDDIEPVSLSGQFMMAMDDPDGGGVWTENNTVITIGLVAPLLPGAVLRVEFGSFADIHGNVNSTGFDWEVTVAGEAQYLPVVDDLTFLYGGTWENVEGGKTTGDLVSIKKIDERTGGEFWFWEYSEHWSDRASKVIVFTDYDRYMVTPSALQFLGFHEEDSGGGGVTQDVQFSTPITWLPLPVTTGTWSGTSTFTEDESDVTVDYQGEVLAGTVDVVGPNMGANKTMDIIWYGCRRVVLDYELSAGAEIITVGQDTFWYAPGAGVVKETSNSDEGLDSHSEQRFLEWAGPWANLPVLKEKPHD